jgi:hypothetical protein
MERQPQFCDQHIGIVEKLSAIFTSVMNIEKTLCQDEGFKRGVFIALMANFLLLAGQLALVSYNMGQMNRQIMINTTRLDQLENLVYRTSLPKQAPN